MIMVRREFLKKVLKYGISLGIFCQLKNLWAGGSDRNAMNSYQKESIDRSEEIEIRVLLGKLKPNDKRLKGMTIKKNGAKYMGRHYKFRKNRNNKIYMGIKVLKENPIKYEKNNYYGKIVILDKDEQFFLINQLPIEEYIKGVVAKEISPQWGAAVLQAQAIATRTYAYHHLFYNQNKSHHIDDTERFQVFGGNIDKVPQSIVQSVEKTRNQILTHRNHPVITFFHACCGGMTEKAEMIWKSKERIPYFKNIRCNFCSSYSKYNWKVEFSKEKMKKIANYLGLREINSIRVSKYTYSRRAKFIDISAQNGTRRIAGNKFRIMLDPSKLYSTKFKINKKNSNTFLITGQGYGHGVGLCQAGAKKMAEKGYSAKRILKFYYKRIRFDNIQRMERKWANIRRIKNA